MHNLHMHEFRPAKDGPQIQLVLPQKLGRDDRGVHVGEQRAVACCSKIIILPPTIEGHGHRGTVWRVIKYVPLLVTDFMGRVYNMILRMPSIACLMGRKSNQWTPSYFHILLEACFISC
jgi:hypothetical protein